MLRSIVIAASTLLFGATVAVPPTLLRSDAPALEVSTSIRPVTQDEYQLLRRTVPGIYRCSVLIHDEPGSNRVWSTEDIVLAPGESGESSNTFGPLRLHFRASLSANLDRSEMTVTVTRDERVITRQTSTTFLQRETSTVQPIK
jgi:hypothetical protein